MNLKWLRPKPEHTVICIGASEWKAEAESVVSRSKPVLLIGAFDTEFIKRLKKKYNLKRELKTAGNKILLWNPDWAMAFQ